MFGSRTSILRSAALAVTLLAVSAVPAWAQHHGGGHGGGSWHGGGGGSWHGDPGAWHGDGGHGGYYNDGYHHWYGGYLPWYGGYGVYPYYDSYYQPYYYYDPGVTGDDSAAYAPPAAEPATAVAEIVVHVPPTAKLWFDDFQTSLTGEWRTFRTEPLKTNKTYAYQVRARWANEKGEPVERTRTVDVHGGSQQTVDFMAPTSGASR
jgi:uncharacterized protein (TIGR03000 family)